MIDDKFNLIIDTGKNKKALFFNMSTIKNLYKLTGESLFKWVDEFFDSNDKGRYATQIILAMFDGYIDAKLLNTLVNDKDAIGKIMMLINSELDNEKVKYKEIEEEETSSGTIDLKNNDNFETWYNNLYYCAIIEFNKSPRWFYRATPRQIKSLSMLHDNNKKDILLSTYSDICKAKNKADEEKEDDDCIILDEYTSMGDVLTGKR